jgi:hypothetical protein
MLFLVGGNAYGDQAASRGSQETLFRQTKGGGIAAQGGPRFGPPPEAFTACEGKTEGSTAQFIAPDGETITGTCRVADGRLVLRPDHPPGNARDGRHGPPPEAYKACEGKKVRSPAQFVNPRGETINGTCEEEDGKLVLRPDANEGGRRGENGSAPGEGRVGR